MVGDSVMRQFLGRLIAAIRGQPMFVEHNFAPFDSYSFDGAVDEVRTFDTLASAAQQLRRGADLPEGHFHVVRIADVRLTEWAAMHRIMRAFQPTHLILGANYWMVKPAESAAAPKRILHSLQALLGQAGAATEALHTVMWQEFPCQARGLWGGTRDWYLDIHGARNEAVVAELQRAWPISKRTEGLRLAFLPNCAVASSGIAPFSVDTVHTSCRWDPVPSRTSDAPPVTEIKATANLDCSDPIGFTAARVLLNELGCGAAPGE